MMFLPTRRGLALRSGGVRPIARITMALIARKDATTRKVSLNERTHASRLAADAMSAAACAVASASSGVRSTRAVESVARRSASNAL